MPAAVHLQLFSGFPPAAWDADRRFDEELGDRLRSLRFERRTPENDLLQVVGAPTMRLFLGEPGWPVPMIVERRFERVRIGDWVAEDVEGRLLDWTGLARPGVPRHVLNVDELAMARRMLSEPPPDGVRAVGAIPEGPTPDEREHPCPAAPSSTALSDWIVESGSNNCYNFAAQVLFRRSLPATPGGASPARLEPGDTCVEVTQALAADGIHG
ncbi:MAG: hypothetical protein OEW19_13680, partial [Acidobacteriota bacterium]|nr:hypothetical protein [Acidobacteriota bacterium]